MKCLKKECNKERKTGFEACSPLHGADIRGYRADLERAFEANTQLGRGAIRDLYTIEDAELYAKNN